MQDSQRRLRTARGDGFVSLAELAELLASLPKPDPGYWNDVAEAAAEQPRVPESPWGR